MNGSFWLWGCAALVLACSDSVPDALPEYEGDAATVQTLDAVLPADAEADVADVDTVDVGAEEWGRWVRADGGWIENDAGVSDLVMGPHNAYGPAARVDYVEIPESISASRGLGCHLVGPTNGTSIRNAFALTAVNDLHHYVEPDERGDIRLLMFVQLPEWREGLSAADVSPTKLNFYFGDLADGQFVILPISYRDENSNKGALISFDAAEIAHRELYIPENRFVIPADYFDLELPIEKLTAKADLALDKGGFQAVNGYIQGYVTHESLVLALDRVRERCQAADAPGFCSRISLFLSRDADTATLVNILLQLLGGYEARIEGTRALTCDQTLLPEEGGCNALGICIEFSLAGVQISGVAPQNALP